MLALNMAMEPSFSSHMDAVYNTSPSFGAHSERAQFCTRVASPPNVLAIQLVT